MRGVCRGRGRFMRGVRRRRLRGFRVKERGRGFLTDGGGCAAFVGVVRATAAKHKGVHAHAQMAAFCVDALPDEHASSFHIVHRTNLRIDLETCWMRQNETFLHL